MSDNRIQWRAAPDLVAWLLGRAERATEAPNLTRAAQQELAQWRESLRVEQARTRWEPAELGCLADILNGSLVQGVGQYLAMEVADAFALDPGALGPKWGIDEAALLAKITGLGAVASAATIDGIARWWADPDRGPHADPESWRAVGFRADAAPTREARRTMADDGRRSCLAGRA